MNPLKSYREQVLLSRAELARKAGLSIATIANIEKRKVVVWKQREKLFWHWT